MFGINPKEIFQKRISDIIIFLFAIHLIAAVLYYIIKRVQPHLKNRADVYHQRKPKCTSEYSFGNWFKNQYNKSSVGNEGRCGDYVTDDDFMRILGNLKTLVDISDNPSKAILDSSTLRKINMMSDSEFENALSLGSLLRNQNKRKCSSEAQTNITINPGVKLNYSRPELVLCDLVPERVVQTSDSCDSFLSACSKNSNTGLRKDLEILINDLEKKDDAQEDTIDEDKTFQKLQKYLKNSLAKTDVDKSFGQVGNNGSQENRLLEMAITEFEKELKPIRDQIRILKESISGYDLACNTRNSFRSDFTSSITGSGLFSETRSGDLSTCCSTDLHSYFSSYHIISVTSFGSLETDPKYKNIKKLDKIASLHPPKNKQKYNQSKKSPAIRKNESPKTTNSPAGCKSCGRSPIAEMYVALSQRNSQASCVGKSKKEKLTCSDNTVTYRIDLNVNLAGVPASSGEKFKRLKERAIAPMTSDPDEILRKASGTLICLRTADKKS